MKKKHWAIMTLAFLIVASLFFAYTCFAAFTEHDSVVQRYAFKPKPLQVKNLDMASLQELDPDQLDQSQEQFGNEIMGYIIGPVWFAQGVVNDRSPLNGVSFAIARKAIPDEPIYIGVMSTLLTGDDLYDLSNWDAAAYLNPDALPTEDFYWVTLDLSNDPLNIPAGTTFYLIAISEDYTFTDGDYWRLGCGCDLGDVYPAGSHYEYQEGVWNEWTWGDSVFRTYTIPNGGGNGGPPQITITSSYQIAAQFLGSLSLLGAVISGTRYFMVV